MIIAITDTYYLWVAYILTALIGLAVGSFLNVVIYRVPLKMSLATPSSHCPQCKEKIKWHDNIPVLSYCLLGGSCRACGAHIPFRYTAVEILNALLWILSMLIFHDNVLYAVLAMIVSSVCICMFFIDLEHMIIPDRLQIVMLIAAIPAVFLDTEYYPISHLIGAVAAGVVFIGTSLVVGKLLGREALGGGDVKLAIISGLLLGWQKLILMMLVASVSASIIMIIRRSKEKESLETPFAPFLTVGLLVALFAGNDIVNWYLSLLSL